MRCTNTSRASGWDDAGTSSVAGIAYICVGAFCLTVNDALAKQLGASYPVDEIVFFRMLFALPLIIGMGLTVGGWQALRTRAPFIQVGRGLIAASAPFAYVTGLTLLPLASNAAISFASPLFITLLAAPLLGEKPGIRQWVATLAGFVGVLLIARPGAATFTWGACLPLAAAFSYALLMVSAGTLSRRRETIWATMFYATLVPLVVSGVLLPWCWQMPALAYWPDFVGVGIFGGTAMTLITQAFRIGAASVVAPFDYTGLLWATLFGWLFWDEIPSTLTISGIGVIIISGIYITYRQGIIRNRRMTGRSM
jgi:drug/metabolite transporter (DMT)-like permease